MAKGKWWLPDKVGGTAVGETSKWIWALWGSLVTNAAQGFLQWLSGHPNWAAIIIGVLVMLGLFAVAFKKNRTEDVQSDGVEVEGSASMLEWQAREIARLNDHRVDLLGTISGLRDKGGPPVPSPDDRDHWMRVANEREGRLNACLASIEKLEVDARLSRSEVERLGDERGKQRAIQMTLDGVKQAARELRRRGAPASFLARPLDRSMWLNDPRASQDWLLGAASWYESAPAALGNGAQNDPVLKSLDFDELMAEIDERERQSEGLTATYQIASSNDPQVAIRTFAAQDGKFGAILYNFGGAMAREVRIMPFFVGRYRFSFDAIDLLPNGPSIMFLPSVAQDGDTRLRDLSLEDPLNEYAKCSGYWRLPFSVFVQYKDRHGREFCSRHDVQVETSGMSKVFLRRCEIHSAAT